MIFLWSSLYSVSYLSSLVVSHVVPVKYEESKRR